MAPEKYNVHGHFYQVATMPVIDQIKMVKRLMPIIAPAIRASGKTDVTNEDMTADILDRVASLSDDDLEYVVNNCMVMVSRDQDGSMVNVWNARVKRANFDDIRLPTVIELVKIVVQDQLGGFFPGSRSDSPALDGVPTTMP